MIASVAVLSLALLPLAAVGQSAKSKPASAVKPANTAKAPAKAPKSEPKKPPAPVEQVEGETPVLEFAATHHPELADLLVRLRSDDPREFEQAIRDLNRTRERLERMKEKTPERYELELNAWKLDSRIRLLAARLAMSSDPQLEKELKSALRQRVEVRAKLLAAERERLEARIEVIDKTVSDLRQHPDQIADREFARLQQSVGQARQAIQKSKTEKEPEKPAKTTASPRAAKPAAGTTSANPAPNKKSNRKAVEQ